MLFDLAAFVFFLCVVGGAIGLTVNLVLGTPKVVKSPEPPKFKSPDLSNLTVHLFTAEGGPPKDVHSWFDLSYANYLTVPRSVLEAMPPEWQNRFVECLEELDEKIDWRPTSGRYWCHLKDRKGRYLKDPLSEYRRPGPIPWRNK